MRQPNSFFPFPTEVDGLRDGDAGNARPDPAEPPLEAAVQPPWWSDQFLCLAVGLGMGLLAGALLSAAAFHAHAAPGWALLLPTLLVIIAWQLAPRSAFPKQLSIRGRSLTMTRTDGSSEEIAAHDVSLVAQRQGLMLSGRPATLLAGLCPPHVLRIVSEQEGGTEWTLPLAPGKAAEVFAAAARACSNSVLVPLDAEPMLPNARMALDPTGARAAARDSVRREFSGQAGRALTGAALLGAMSAALAVLLATGRTSHLSGIGRATQIGIEGGWMVAAGVATIAMGRLALRARLRGARVAALLAAESSREEPRQQRPQQAAA